MLIFSSLFMEALAGTAALPTGNTVNSARTFYRRQIGLPGRPPARGLPANMTRNTLSSKLRISTRVVDPTADEKRLHIRQVSQGRVLPPKGEDSDFGIKPLPIRRPTHSVNTAAAKAKLRSSFGLQPVSAPNPVPVNTQ